MKKVLNIKIKKDESDKLSAESDKLWAEGNKLRAERREGKECHDECRARWSEYH